MRYRECYQKGVSVLKEAGVPDAALDAELLLEHVCGTTRSDLLAHGDREVAEQQVKEFEALLELRARRIPLQQITGEQEFMGLSFQVNEHVLIPRQDTEILVERALKILKPGMNILDMCTGSGCILISLLYYGKGCRGIGVDVSAKALEIAEGNCRQVLGKCTRETSASLLQSDLFEKVVEKYDMIVSNPPYIPTRVIDELMPEVRDHEPLQALDGREDGLFFYRCIAGQTGEYLKPGGWLLFEIGCEQAADVSDLLVRNGFQDVEVIKDYAGLDRVVCGKRKG
ncbi:MAG: peptide chain release factor N(5)-glutamine methyltransferase [Lachnospiraceae bacterium]|nr:peptide chain release factor N(5)-glutamine methyltransferase [Lachnospiraceae bacterium]